MQNKLLTLIKINFFNTYKILSLTKKKAILVFLVLGYVLTSLMFMINMFLNGIFNTLKEVNMLNYYITIVFAFASIISIFFSIFSAKSALFDNRDNDLLLSLPLKKSHILTSKVLILAFYNLLLGLMIIIPGFIIYVKQVPFDIIYIIEFILLTIFFPIIPTVIASLFGYFIAYLTSKFKRKNSFELISYIMFISIYFIAMNNGASWLDMLLKNPKILDTLLKTVFLPIYLIHLALVNNNLLYVLLFILLNIGVLYLFVITLNKKYFKIISSLSISKPNVNFKLKETKVTGIKLALLKKELKQYFSSAIYVFNTMFGVVIIFIAGIASFFYSLDEILMSFTGENPPTGFELVTLVIIFVISLTVTTNSSVSIERNNIWIMKMLPVSLKDILKTKVLVNQIILIPLTIISLLLFTINSYITYPEMILLSILTVIYGSYIANFGLIINLLFPKLDAINDTVIVKQSTASFIGIMGGITTGIIMYFIVMAINFPNLTKIIICLIISLVLYLISKIILNKWGINKFKNIG